MSPKYGRLYTESDVERIIAEALILQHKQNQVRVKGVLEHIDPKDLTFPADEPLFLLRGKDICAAESILEYVGDCEASGASQDHVTAARKAAWAMVEWQKENPDRIKVPD